MPRNLAGIINTHSMRPTLRALIPIIFSLAAVLSLPQNMDATEHETPKGVLLLTEQPPAQMIYFELVRGLRLGLKTDSKLSVSVYSEYLDGLSENEIYRVQVTQLLKAKYSQRKIDLIVIPGAVVNPNLVRLRDEVWPNTPIIAVGVFLDDVKSVNFGPKMIFFTGALDLKGTIAEALRLLPKTQYVALVINTNLNDRYVRSKFDQEFKAYQDRLQLIDLWGQTVDELKVSLSSLPENTIVLFINLQEDRYGRTYFSWDEAATLIPLSNAPVFSVHSTWIPHGIVGGVLLNPSQTGRETGELALRILRGEQFEDGTIFRGNWNQLTLNWRQLQKWKISEDNASPNAVILFKEPSVWEKYRWVIIGIAAFILLQFLLIGGLTINRIRIKRYQRILDDRIRFEELAAELSAAFVNIPISQIDREVQRWLGNLTDFLEVDRGQLLEFSSDGRKLSEICSHGKEPPPSDWLSKFHQPMVWSAQQLRNTKPLILSRLPDDLPAEAVSEREFARLTGITSNLTIPLNAEGSNKLLLLSFSLLGSERSWPVDLVNRLQIIGGTLANAIARKQSAERAAQLRQELFHVSRVATMGELAASIAHEVNQPLFAIMTSANAGRRWLKSLPPNIGEALENFEMISQESMRASEIITRIRELLKKGQVISTELNLKEVITSVTSLVRNEMAKRNISLKTDFCNDLGAVSGDRIQLQQVLLNLIINAADSIDLADNGRREIVVSTTRGDNGEVVVSVRDSGTGLAPEIEARIFDAFYTTKPYGMGMGLSINRTIIEAHDGKLWAENNNGAGATFRFTLPASEELKDEGRFADSLSRG